MIFSLSKLSLLGLSLSALATVAVAQAPPGYYSGVIDTNPSILRTTLNAAIDDHQIFPYTSGSTDTWDVLKQADEDPNNSGRILDIYKNESYAKASGGNSNYNREHSWPNSLGFPNDNGKNYPYTDCHQLFLCDIAYNSARGHQSYGSAPGGAEYPTVFNDGAGGGSGTYPGNSNWSNGTNFEVWSDRRGDIARAMFYMDVRYEGGTHGVTGWSEPDLILTDSQALIDSSSTGNNESVAYMGLLSVLLSWHAQDPVDAKELARNDAVFNFQGNRNPFVDHPEWVDCLFNANCGVDMTPPAIPTGLVATASGTSINLDWADNTELDLGGYHVWRGSSAGGPYTELTAGLSTPSNWLDSGLTSGVTYFYVVTAEDLSNNVSAYSGEVSATTTMGGSGGSGLPWINELHYDNSGGDVGEFVEVAGPAGLDLAGYDLVAYNGNGGGSYNTVNLSGQLTDLGGCVGALAFDFAGLQNGAPDGIALVDPTGAVLEFLSYEGSLTAADGPAMGMTSVDIGVFEDSSVAVGESLQLGGSGADSAAFVWQAAQLETRSAVNQGQSFVGGCSLPCGTTQYDLGASPVNTLVLLGSGSPNVGSSLGLVASNLPIGGAFFGISLGKAYLPLLGGIVLVDPLGLVQPLAFQASVTGSATLMAPIPADPAFAGVTAYAQAFALDATQPAGYVFSGGLEIIVCP